MIITLILILLIVKIIQKNNEYKLYLKDINYSGIEERVKSEENFVILVTQDGCSHCEEFLPKVKEVIVENKIIIYHLNLSNATIDDKKNIIKLFGNIGTPTTIFIRNGIEEVISNRIIGNSSKSKLVEQLKLYNFIKKAKE